MDFFFLSTHNTPKILLINFKLMYPNHVMTRYGHPHVKAYWFLTLFPLILETSIPFLDSTHWSNLVCDIDMSFDRIIGIIRGYSSLIKEGMFHNSYKYASVVAVLHLIGWIHADSSSFSYNFDCFLIIKKIIKKFFKY